MARNFLLLLIALVVGCATRPAAKPQFAGVVAAATPEAADAGREILVAGGNAVDAAVAVALTLGVTEPAGSGLGGQTVMIVQRPGEDAFVIDGTSRAPAAVPEHVAQDDLHGRRLTTVPTTVRTLDFAHRRFGSGALSWADVVEPAIGSAREGFSPGPFRAQAFVTNAKALRQDSLATATFIAHGPGDPTTLIRQPVLAKTLERLAKAGANDFYAGAIASEIAADMGQHGGWLTAQDLASVGEPRVVPPLVGGYRGHRVSTVPPPYGGWVVLLALAILDRAPAEELATPGAFRDIWLAEALRYAHRARATRPIPNLIDHTPHVRKRTDTQAVDEALATFDGPGRGETTHFSVVDGNGVVVAVTQSINAYFGAKVMHPTLGFFYNDYMHEFVLGDPAHPFALRAGAIPYSSMSATIVARQGAPILGLGSPGSARIISAVVQVVSHWIDVDGDVVAAVKARRLHAKPVAEVDELFLEQAREPISWTERKLAPRGPPSKATSGLDPYFGGVHAVALEGGKWTGAADPRRDGKVVQATR